MSSCDICDELAAIKATLAEYGDKLSILLTGVGALVAAASAQYWNSADKGSDITLTNSDKTAQNLVVSGAHSVRSVTSHGSGKYYCEMAVAATTSSDNFLGIMNGSASVSDFAGIDTNGAGYLALTGEIYENSNPTSYGTAESGLTYTIGLAVDVTNSLLYVALNNTWQNSADPAAGTGGYSFSVTGDLFLAATPSAEGGDSAVTLATADGEFTYTPPTGFTAWG